MIAKTPSPPYYAVIFTSILHKQQEGYEEMATKMIEIAAQQEGFLGVESARDGLGITVSYWKSLSDIQKWKNHSAHLLAQKRGKEEWYRAYKVRIASVEREYGQK